MPPQNGAGPPSVDSKPRNLHRLGGTVIRFLEPLPGDQQRTAGEIFTAVPRGKGWQIRIIDDLGADVRVGAFSSRVSAFAAACAMARLAGGRALP